jgi:hypothetical protein
MSRQINRSSIGKIAMGTSAVGAKSVRRAALLISIASITLSGCASHGAPSFVLFGAFFPAWMLCSLAGILGAVAARGMFVAAGLNNVLPYQLFVCSSAGLAVAIVIWLIWFG